MIHKLFFGVCGCCISLAPELGHVLLLWVCLLILHQNRTLYISAQEVTVMLHMTALFYTAAEALEVITLCSLNGVLLFVISTASFVKF